MFYLFVNTVTSVTNNYLCPSGNKGKMHLIFDDGDRCIVILDGYKVFH